MDVNSSALHDKRLSNGPSFRRGPGRESSHHMTTLPSHCTTLTIYKDEKGYGMKVSGDNPVYVQSVKEGGAAERAGLHSGDTILKVNGVNVMNLTHTEVVELIKAEAQVILTVQQSPLPLRERSGSTVMPSPNLPRQLSCHQSRDRITAPQPVDNEKLRQFEYQRAHTLKLMLEKEQRYVESLRSKLAKCTDSGTEVKILQDLHGAERRIQALQTQLEQEGMEPPPLPNRSRRPTLSPPPPVRPSSNSSSSFVLSPTPPPLPPRQYLLLGPGDQLSPSSSPGANHQIHTHQRTKSSPDNLTSSAHLAEASKRLIAAESMSELSLAKTSKGGVAWEVDRPTSPTTPPGTPPPPYNMGYSAYDDTVYSHIAEEEDSPPRAEASFSETDHVSSPTKSFNFINQGASPQQPIISMEDEDMSDQEMSQMEDHGPFKRWNKLSKHQAHLAVFLNYVISNSDPSSLLFYLVTDLYKEGSAKEMKKWAYEIHSSFLVPGAPLRLNNVDENVAREIDDVLFKESDKEEILRKIFWKARQKAKEELNEQLADFQAKRTAGLGTLFGPKDTELEESIHDKNKEIKIIESILIPKLEPYLEDIERGTVDDRRFTTGAALGTVLSKVFGIRGTHFNSLLERCPTYVSKDKSLKARLIGKTRKVSTRGHHCIAHQYYLVTYCNHCQFIIWGIGPQGYQCSNCGLNIHRHCVTVLEENCPGPMVKKEKGNDRISKLMDKIRPENARRKPSSLNLSTSDRAKRVAEEVEVGEHDTGEKGGDKSSRGLTRTEKKSDSTREGEETPQEASEAANNFQEINQHVVKNKPSTTSINRSESYKERVHQKRQLRERRKTSDPNLSKSNNDTDVDAQALSYNTNSGSSSNSSLSNRSLESPSQSLETVGVGSGGQPPGQQSWGSDMEAEPDPPDWTTSVPEEVFSQLSPNDRKRQEVINELFYSERSHVQALKVLDQIFYKPMKDQQVLPQDQINLLFSNLEEILTFHSQFNASMKAKRKEGVVIGNIAQLLLDQFDDVNGEAFKKAAATFCAKQQIALETLKERRRKDPKLNSFLSEAESNPYCRRRQLKDIIPTGWQRLTKYPLLFESLAKYTPNEEEEELSGLKVAIEKSKELLNVVDMAVKEAEDEHRLAEIQRRLDKSPFDKTDHPIAQEFKNLDLTKHKLIHEGSLCWRMTNRQKTTELHVLLLADAIILLQKQDEKFLLKFNSLALSPIIKVSTVLVRHNAVDKKALFLVNTSHNGAQIYDLVANSISEKRKWFKHISDAAEAYKQREGKHREKRVEGTTSDFEPCEPRDTRENDDHLEGSGDAMLSPQRSYPTAESPIPGATSGASGSSTPQPSSPQTLVDKLGSEPPGTPEKHEKPARTPHPNNSSEPSVSEVHVATSTAETTLVDPSEVVVSSRDVLTAEPVLTPLEKLKRKDELVRQILYEKQEIVADILHVPREEFENIADLAGEPSVDKDPSELVLAAVNQAHELSLVVNEALRLSEEEAVVATSETTAVSGPKSGRLPGIPVHKISGIASALTSHLTQLLNIMTERDEERERLRRELQRSREQLHALHEKYDHNGPSDPVSNPVSNWDEAKSENPPAESTHNPAVEVFVDALTEGEEITHEEKPISASLDN